MSLYMPSAFGRVGKRGTPGKADEIYEDFVGRYQDSNIDRRERLTRINTSYHLRVVLVTQARKQDPDRDPFKQDEAAERIIQQRSRKYDRAQHTKGC